MTIKDLIRKTLMFLHIDLTISLKYDRLTNRIIKEYVSKDSLCVDIGCHRGDVLELFIKQSPNKKHYAFEPLPHLYKYLKEKYSDKSFIYNFALSDSAGKAEFNYVRNAPAYSGLKQRVYKVTNPEIELLQVELKTLDSLIDEAERVDFIKIDVEGAELKVLQGAERIVSKYKPYVLFEFGIGGSDFYGSSPEEMFEYFETKKMGISLLAEFLENKPNLSLKRFCDYFGSNEEFYFIAHKL